MEDGYVVPSSKNLSGVAPRDLLQCDPTDIAELSRQEYQRQLQQRSSSNITNFENTGSLQSSSLDDQPQTPPSGSFPDKEVPFLEEGFTRAQFERHLRAQAEKEKGPMSGAQYRQQQALGVKPEMASVQGNGPPSYEEFLAANYPHLLQEESSSRKKAGMQKPEAPLSEDDILRLEALKEFEKSQMPAVPDKENDGVLVKTIEHYTFADGDDNVSFYIHFGNHLFNGAAAFIQEAQVKVESRSTSLEIRIQDVPVSDKSPGLLAEWRLTLSPLFGRVEPTLTTHKIRNGKLSVKLCKAKVGPWKKGVKYS